MNAAAETNCLTLLFLGLLATQAHAQMNFLQNALRFMGLSLNANHTDSWEIEKLSRGQCVYNFETYALMSERHTCYPDDEHILHLTEYRTIQCLKWEPSMMRLEKPTLLMMTSAKEIVNLLQPIGNATKRNEPGSCVIVLFCTPTSLPCAHQSILTNLLPHIFPNVPVAYIDAYEFTRFNAEFGVVSLPTFIIFHQGRPMFRYPNKEGLNLPTFIQVHTNLTSVPVKRADVLEAYSGPLSEVPKQKTDIYLICAWAFILICLANYMRRTPFWKQLVEMVKRNWRESEETQMEMVD